MNIVAQVARGLASWQVESKEAMTWPFPICHEIGCRNGLTMKISVYPLPLQPAPSNACTMWEAAHIVTANCSRDIQKNKQHMI